eukprot:SAG31_NODE_3459_length_4250_cov_1.437244_4_plen_485_part_00
MLGLEMPEMASPAKQKKKSAGGFVSTAKGVRVGSFQWYDWQTLQPVGTVLPSPRLVVWDPELQYCLTCYARSFVVWALVPTIRYIRRIRSSQPIVSALWHSGQLLYASATQICALYPTHADTGPVVLAEFGRGSSSDGANSGTARLELFVPPPETRCGAGALTLLRVVQDTLVMADAGGQLHGISLGGRSEKGRTYKPGMLLRHLIVHNARAPISQEVAEKVLELSLLLAPSEHDAVAQFIVEGRKAYEETQQEDAAELAALALHLPGLSTCGRLQICLTCQLWEQANEVLRGLACSYAQAGPAAARMVFGAHDMVASAAIDAGAVDVGLSVLHQAATWCPPLGLARLVLALGINGRQSELSELIEGQLQNVEAGADKSAADDPSWHQAAIRLGLALLHEKGALQWSQRREAAVAILRRDAEPYAGLLRPQQSPAPSLSRPWRSRNLAQEDQAIRIESEEHTGVPSQDFGSVAASRPTKLQLDF